jgi:predicted esterase
VRSAVSALTLAAIVVVAGFASANPHGKTAHVSEPPKASGPQAEQPAWCGSDHDAMTDDICHINGGAEKDGRRTLVIFLHGAIAKNVNWQWLQERALARMAKQSSFEAIFPRAPLGSGGFVWPGTVASQEQVEQKLIDSWMAAKKTLEAKNGKAFDEVFVMGFSSGAYFASSLALRGKMKVDGFAVFAGGQPGGAAADAKKLPIFVGVCADDSQTAAHSRSFGGSAIAAGFPTRVEEQKIGHMFGDAHVAHAASYLRGAVAKKNAAQ